MSIQRFITDTANKLIVATMTTLLKDIDEQNDGPVPQISRIELSRCPHPEHPIHAGLAGPWGVIMAEINGQEEVTVDTNLSLQTTIQAAADSHSLPIRIVLGDYDELKADFPEIAQTRPLLELMQAINADHPLTQWYAENAPDTRLVAAVIDNGELGGAPAPQAAPQARPQLPDNDDRPWPGQYL